VSNRPAIDFDSDSVQDSGKIIKQYFIGSPSYIAAPHTAVGLSMLPVYSVRSFSMPSVVQVILSTAHPAKFSEAVTKALATSQSFDFEWDVLPQEFRGLLEKERRVIDVDEPSEELVKKVIESKASL
ncbi:hypothetical protein EDB85DRAFT_1863450, partial [Lactarius pseudohatsudake]